MELSPTDVQQWLRNARLILPDAEVLAVEDLGVAGSGMVGDVRRFGLRYVGHQPQSPTSIVAKFPVPREPESLPMAQLEQQFYAADPAVATPRVLHLRDDGALFLEDLGSHGWVPQVEGLTPEQAELALAAVATVHGMERLQWKPPTPQFAPITQFCVRQFAGWEGGWPAVLGDIPHAVTSNLDQVAVLLNRNPTVVHGDLHSGNIHFGSGGATAGSEDAGYMGGRVPKVRLIDFQFVQWASPMLDVARLLATSLTTPVRRECEGALLASYEKASGRDIDLVALRAGMLWNCVVPLALHVAWMRATGTTEWAQDLPILQRCVECINDWDAVEPSATRT